MYIVKFKTTEELMNTPEIKVNDDVIYSLYGGIYKSMTGKAITCEELTRAGENDIYRIGRTTFTRNANTRHDGTFYIDKKLYDSVEEV